MVLRALERGPTEADFVGKTEETVRSDSSAHSTRLSVVLIPSPKRLSVDSAWADTLVKRGIVAGVCYAPRLEQCDDSVLTTYVSLDLPGLRADTLRVAVKETGVNPRQCQEGQSFVGGWDRSFLLTRQNGQWTVAGPDPGLEWSWSGVCGQPAPEEAARIARLEREDSLLRETISPIAGTYRVAVIFSSGDSSIFYSRTELHPMGAIRGRRREDAAGDDYKPILGYYLATCSAASVSSLPKRFGFPCLQSYYAVSTAPIVTTPDSTLWHGEVEPLVEVTYLDPRPAVQSEAHALFGASEELRDAEWYYMPGVWVVSHDGRVRHDWRITRGSQLVYRVRADRISRKTLASRSR